MNNRLFSKISGYTVDYSFFFLMSVSLITSCDDISKDDLFLESPDGKIKLTFIENGGIAFTLNFNDNLVLGRSDLGLILQDDDFFNGLSLVGISGPTTVRDDYMLAHGKRKINKYLANQKILHLVNKASRKLDIVFNVSNEGITFKYHFPDSLATISKITEEKTSFQFPIDTKAWLQPMSDAKTGWQQVNPAYEENYLMEIPVGTSSPTDAGWVYPALFKVNETWVLITESGLASNYCGTRLEQDSPNGKYKVGFPQEEEKIFGGPLFPESSMPWSSPWRVIAVGSLANIIESNLGNDVAKPAIDMDRSHIKPGSASWSWALLKDESITYDIQKQFIDYAADMQWPYCLVDVNWDTTIGYKRIEELSAYAKSKGVGLILWYNSAGDWNTAPYHPRSELLTAEDRKNVFTRLQKMGIAGIKVDFFGGDGQSVIQYYHEILMDASKYNLLINFHGATIPRGWHRTYPHLMTMESVKGFEFITFEQTNADLGPGHCALLPFTRNAFDPMDFTPMSLDSIPNIRRRSSAVFELALPVLFLSGIQHMAETPQGMSGVPNFVKDYLKGMPTDWDDTRFIDGYPGKYVAIARRKGNDWFVSGINAQETDQSLSLDLSFTEKSKYILITDGDDGQLFNKTETLHQNSSSIDLNVKAKGGFVMKL